MRKKKDPESFHERFSERFPRFAWYDRMGCIQFGSKDELIEALAGLGWRPVDTRVT